MTEIASLGIKIEATDVKKAIDELGRLENKSGDVERATDGMGLSFKAMGVLALAATAAAAGALAGKILSNTIEAELAVSQLNAVLKSTQGAAGLTSDELQRMATELRSITTYGDETIIGIQSLLLTFTQVGKEIFPQASLAILDMSTAMGQDLKSSAIQVGKALNDPIEGISSLTRAGVQFTDTQKDMIKTLAETGNVAGAQALILKELQTEFGGSAEAARNTLGGALSGLKNSLGELLEADGSSLPGMTASVNELTAVLNSDGVKEGFQTITGGLISMTASVASFIAGIGRIAGGIYDAFDNTESIDEMQLKIDGLSQHIFAIQRETERTSIVEWLLGKDPNKGVAEIENASKQIEVLAEKMRALNAPDAPVSALASGGGGATSVNTGLPMPTDEQIQEWLLMHQSIAQLEMEALRETESEKQLIELESQETRRMNLLQFYSDEETYANDKAEKLKLIKDKELADQITRGESGFSTMIGQMASHNKTFFQIQKLYRISKLAMETPAAVWDSYVWANSWGGPAAGVTAAGLTAAAALGYASQLAGANYGGGGSASAGGGQNAVTGPVSPGVTTLFPQDQQQAARGATTIIINGTIIGHEDYVNNTMLPLIKTAISERDYVLVEANSLNGLELSA